MYLQNFLSSTVPENPISAAPPAINSITLELSVSITLNCSFGYFSINRDRIPGRIYCAGTVDAAIVIFLTSDCLYPQKHASICSSKSIICFA